MWILILSADDLKYTPFFLLTFDYDSLFKIESTCEAIWHKLVFSGIEQRQIFRFYFIFPNHIVTFICFITVLCCSGSARCSTRQRFSLIRPVLSTFARHRPPSLPSLRVATPVNSSISLIPMFRRDHGEDPANRCPISEAPYWSERSSRGRGGLRPLWSF